MDSDTESRSSVSSTDTPSIRNVALKVKQQQQVLRIMQKMIKRDMNGVMMDYMGEREVSKKAAFDHVNGHSPLEELLTDEQKEIFNDYREVAARVENLQKRTAKLAEAVVLSD